MAKKKGKDVDKKSTGRAEYNVTPEKFIEVWESSETAQEVADRLGMPKPIVLARASTYRSLKIKLKKMKRESKRALNVDECNRLIERIRAGQSVEQDDDDSAPAAKKSKSLEKIAQERLSDMLQHTKQN